MKLLESFLKVIWRTLKFSRKFYKDLYNKLSESLTNLHVIIKPSPKFYYLCENKVYYTRPCGPSIRGRCYYLGVLQ